MTNSLNVIKIRYELLQKHHWGGQQYRSKVYFNDNFIIFYNIFKIVDHFHANPYNLYSLGSLWLD